ncbi:MAG: signal peptidase I [Dehalococcoidales bacterium]
MKSLLREILITIILAAAIFFGARATFQGYEVFQSSMQPNFAEGQRVMVLKAAYWFGEPQRGDVVVFKAPDGTDEEWIKRIIGLPGDTVEVVRGAVYVNGEKLDEPYVKRSFSYSFQKEVVPPEYYFFLGDNRDISNDSHRGWLMPRSNLIGKAWLVYWPASDWAVVPGFPLNDQVAVADSGS